MRKRAYRTKGAGQVQKTSKMTWNLPLLEALHVIGVNAFLPSLFRPREVTS